MEVRKRSGRPAGEKRVSIHTIAKMAGVSSATVSRVLNNSDLVKRSTRERVLKAAKEVGFRHPSRLARALRTNRTGLVGLVVTDILNPYYALLAREIEDAAKAENMIVLLSNDDADPHVCTDRLRVFGSMNVEGIFISNWIGDGEKREELRRLQSEGVSIVVIGDMCDEEEFDVVAANTERAAQQAVSYLLSLGHQRIGFVGISRVAPRARGYVKEMDAAGLPAATLLLESVVSPRRLRELMPSTLPDFVKRHALTAVVAHNDVFAIEAIRTLQANGYDVPDDISVIGFDNTPQGETSTPALTSFALPCREMARIGVEIIRQRREEPDRPEPIKRVLEAEWILRNSVAAV